VASKEFNKDRGGTGGPGRLQALTYVDQVVGVIIGQAARGRILPGGRINELELSRELGISRAPIREALRILVAQGVAESVPYQGVRLGPMTAERVHQISEVRFELEKLALRKLSSMRKDDTLIKTLENLIEDMRVAVRRSDLLALVTLDADFHEAIMRAAENPVLLKFWQMLRPQLIIMFGLGAMSKPLRKIVEEHRRLLSEFESGKLKGIEDTLSEHILADNMAIDYASINPAAPLVARKKRASTKTKTLRPVK
jgi:DNA-binding GntR family transcriptional regulator